MTSWGRCYPKIESWNHIDRSPKSYFFIRNLQFKSTKQQFLDSLIHYYCYYCIIIIASIAKMNIDSIIYILLVNYLLPRDNWNFRNWQEKIGRVSQNVNNFGFYWNFTRSFFRTHKTAERRPYFEVWQLYCYKVWQEVVFFVQFSLQSFRQLPKI